MTSDATISNMRMRGFEFNDDMIPVVCPSPLSGRELAHGNPFGMYGMVHEDYELAFRDDRTLYIRYPSSDLVGNTLMRNTLTYVVDLEGFPVQREDNRSMDQVINEHWMTAASWSRRLDNLRQVHDDKKVHVVQWWKNGEMVLSLTIGDIIDIMLDPERLEANKAYVRGEMEAMRKETPSRLQPKALSDPSPRRDKQNNKPVQWLPRKDNGFQHVDLENSELPEGITRLALEHSTLRKEGRIPAGYAVLRGWGTNLSRVVINTVPVEFRYIPDKNRYEVEVNNNQLEGLL